MNINECELWLSDMDRVLEVVPELGGMSGASIMITGCTGLVCSAIVDLIIRWNDAHSGDGEKIRIYAAGRNVSRIKERFEPFSDREWFQALAYDALSFDNRLPERCDYIIHGAGNSSPDMIVKEPVETMLGNILGVRNLLEYGRQAALRRLLYISSSEVYGKKDGDHPNRPDEYGSIDILNPRNSYALGKSAAETLCVSYAEEYGMDTVMIRPGHIYGPTASPKDAHVSSAWAYKAARGEEIVMKSDGSQIRSYCYCPDCASAIIKALLKGEPCKAYNVSNPGSVISIREMGEILSGASGTAFRMEVPTDNEKKAFNPMKNSSLDSSELQALGWRGVFNAREGFAHTVSIIKKREECREA